MDRHFIIKKADFSHPQVINLLGIHLNGMHSNTPQGHVYALDLTGLQQADIALYTLWDSDILLGMGAIKALDDISGEIKSMRTHPDHLRKGVAARLLVALLEEARGRQYQHVHLETGTGDAFEPAIAMYKRHGFVSGEAFGDYEKSDFNQFFTLAL